MEKTGYMVLENYISYTAGYVILYSQNIKN